MSAETSVDLGDRGPESPPPASRRSIEVRWVLAVAALVLTFAASTGALTSVVFSQVSTTKWILLTVLPAGAAGLALSERRITYLAGLCIAAVPFSGLEVTLGGVGIELQWAVLVPSVVVAFLVPNRADGHPLRPGRDLRRPRLVVASLVTLVVLVPAILGGSDPSGVLLQVAALAAFAYVVARACALDRHAPLWIALAIVVTAAAEGLLAIDELRTGRAFSAYGGGVASYGSSYFFGYDGTFRPTGSFSDPISLGNMLAVSLPFAFTGYAGTRNVYLRAIFAISGVIVVAGLTITLSRMSWVGAVVGVLIALILSPRRDWSRQLVGIGVAVVVLFTSVIAFAGDQLQSRFSSLFDPTAQGVSTANGDLTREKLWSAALDTFGHHPFTGVGFGNLVKSLPAQVAGASDQSHAHSTYFQYLAEAGLLGAAAILLVVASAALDLRHRLVISGRNDWIAAASAGGLAALLVVWSTDYTIRYTPVLLWMALPLLLAAVARPETARRGRPL